MNGTSGILIINGQARGVPPHATLDPFILSNHQIYYPGKNFLGNKYIKFWVKDYRPNSLGGLNWADLSGKWYYAINSGITELATPGTSNHGWGIAIDLHAKTVTELQANENAMKWFRDNIEIYGWSRERGVSPKSDPFHLIYFNEDSFNAKSKPTTIIVPQPIPDPKPKSLIKPNNKTNTPGIKLLQPLFQGASTKIQGSKKTTVTNALPNQFKPANSVVLISSNSSNFKIPKKRNYQNNSNVFPSLKNTDGLPPKVFQVAEPYVSSSDVGGYLTYDEFFEMLIHPQVGNFSFAIAAIFTAISAVEANVGLNKIGIGVANGSEHLGFLQLRCKPENDSNNNIDSKDGWFGTSMLWNVPYNEFGELSATGSTLKYAWESFIKDKNIVKEIKQKNLTGNSKVAASIIQKNLPDFKGEYNTADRKNAASYLADWARIPANQIWMMKSKFKIGPSNFKQKLPTIVAPYWPQDNLVQLSNNVPSKNVTLNYKYSIFEPWDDQTWPNLTSTEIAFDVLINWFKNNGIFEDDERPVQNPTLRQAQIRARQELQQLLKYYKSADRSILEGFIGFDNRGLT